MTKSIKTVPLIPMNITVVGYIVSTYFYKTKFLLMNLVKHRHDLVNKCIIKGVLDIEWTRFWWKLNQRLGGKKRQDTVAVFVNKTYIGNYQEFREYLITKHNFAINEWTLDYKRLEYIGVQNYLNNENVIFVRMALNIDTWNIGHIVFALFHKLVPKTCDYFVKLCMDKNEGYLSSPVHRIDIDNGFIQAGRISNKTRYLTKENYLITHDRRGVLSLASHYTYFNGPEFVISLQPNFWMNNTYVAFGHMVDGEKTLKIIEKLSGSREIFNRKIHLSSCDVLLGCTRLKAKTELKPFLRSVIHKRVYEAMYIHLYGRPEPLHIPFITDLQYIKSIVKILMNNVMQKIEHYQALRENNLKPSKYSRKLSHLNHIPDTTLSLNPFKIESDVLIKSKQFSKVNESKNGLSETSIITKTITEKSKFRTASNTSNKVHTIHLPKNHKNYWKYKKIYENIAN